MKFEVKLPALVQTDSSNDGCFELQFYLKRKVETRTSMTVKRYSVFLPQDQISIWPGQDKETYKICDITLMVETVKLLGKNTFTGRCLNLGPLNCDLAGKELLFHLSMLLHESDREGLSLIMPSPKAKPVTLAQLVASTNL